MTSSLTRHRIHIFGASGSGTTTLGKAIAAATGLQHLDTDDFYWEPTNPPFTQKREPGERLALLLAEFERASAGWVLSGSLCGWGDSLIPRFQLAVFLTLDPRVRLQRLRARAAHRYGAERLATGGDLAEAHATFLAWAQQYDTGGLEIRSRTLHEQWMESLPIPILRLDSQRSVPELCAAVIGAAY
ncbi:MAG: AAA family ATPase [Planctomycetaceae bacterium]|nr:AAA family ATPase [Planctomycetaceae bacterium]